MTKVPTEGPPQKPAEPLDELDDEAIVAAQSAAHAPIPRQSVKVESESVVISSGADEPSPEPDDRRPKTVPRGLKPYRRNDPTLVLKRPPATKKSPKSRPLGPWLIWGGAAVVAFGFGGILAMITAASDSSSGTAVVETATAAPPSPTPSHASVRQPAAEPGKEPVGPGAVAADTKAERPDAAAASASDLLVEKKVKPKPRRLPRRPVLKRRPAAANPPSDIPSGI